MLRCKLDYTDSEQNQIGDLSWYGGGWKQWYSGSFIASIYSAAAAYCLTIDKAKQQHSNFTKKRQISE